MLRQAVIRVFLHFGNPGGRVGGHSWLATHAVVFLNKGCHMQWLPFCPREKNLSNTEERNHTHSRKQTHLSLLFVIVRLSRLSRLPLSLLAEHGCSEGG